ncbi:MAG: hypothetical protein KGM42_20990 [Hyphomicrobiales bacterium]|nr:hypothetical protein [Hyphomicrobiales bacterium]
MPKPIPFLRAAAPLALAIAAGAAFPHAAAAQVWGAWGGWGPPPARIYGPPPGAYGDDTISPRIVARILNAHGYRLVSAPTYSGERLFAVGENGAGLRARFVIDAYDGALLRVARLGVGDPVLRPPGFIPRPPANYAYGGPGEFQEEAPLAPAPRPLAPKHKAKPKPHTASRMVEPAPAPLVRPAPSVATKPPAVVRPVEKPAPVHAAVPPAPAPTPPLAPDAKPPETQSSTPVDIGPKVEPVARAPEAAPAPAQVPRVETKPAAPAPATAAPATDAGEPGPDMSR